MHVLAFSCLVALATNSSRMSSNTIKSIHLNLLPTLSRKYVVCHSSVFIKRHILHQVAKIIFYSLLRIFSQISVEFCKVPFLYVLRWLYDISISMCWTMIYLYMVNQLCIPAINSSCSKCISLFLCYWI